MHILVINSGSSSLKLHVIDTDGETVFVTVIVERIGEQLGRQRCTHGVTGDQFEIVAHFPNHLAAFHSALKALNEQLAAAKIEISAVGHRVVHGGALFQSAMRINADTLARLRQLGELAPLHNPAGISGIEAALTLTPNIPHIAVFDTAFHHTLPEHAYRYAVPEQWYHDYGVRRYGFHGSSHRYLAHAAARLLQRPVTHCNLITLHLGNGASATAIAGGISIDTSMGFTPLEGLMMGTRSGDMDPAVVLHLAAKDIPLPHIANQLNHHSGLQALCDIHDMREILQRAEQGDARAKLAITMYCYRVKKYIGAYSAILSPLHAIVFSGGVGENAATIRTQVTEGLAHMGIVVDAAQNAAVIADSADISAPSSAVRSLVIRSHEELEIARQTRECVFKR